MHRVIVLDQLYSNSSTLYLHHEPQASLPSFQEAVPILESSEAKLPPGSGESFFLAGINETFVISGYDTQYESTAFGSSFSSLSMEDLPAITDLANSIARFVQSLVFDEGDPVEVEEEYLQQLLACLAVNGDCGIIEQTLHLTENSLTGSLRRSGCWK